MGVLQFTNLKASNFLLGELAHPNKMPFSGILTYFDVPSDRAPHGSDGKKVLIPADVGIPALDSLVGMGINFIEGSMDDHDPKNKIGVIESATALGRTENGIPIFIEGYIYASDFPKAADDIKLYQDVLGFSYDTTNTLLMDGVYEGEPVAVATQVVFTGACILYSDDAAYTNTSIAASADTTEQNDNEEGETLTMAELQEILSAIQASAAQNAEAIQNLKDYVDTKLENFKKEDELADTIADNLEDVKETTVQAGTEDAAKLAAAAVQTELEKTKVELEKTKAELKASADAVAAQRKSSVYPSLLVAKHDGEEKDKYTELLASVDKDETLTLDERWAKKMQLRDEKIRSMNK